MLVILLYRIVRLACALVVACSGTLEHLSPQDLGLGAFPVLLLGRVTLYMYKLGAEANRVSLTCRS